MHKKKKDHAPALILAEGIVLLLLAPAGGNTATVLHQAIVVANPITCCIRARDEEMATTSANINRTVVATQVLSNWTMTAAIGEFGSVALNGEVNNIFTENHSTIFSTEVNISSDENVNLLGVPQHARLNFIIDGGHFNFFGFNYEQGYDLTVAGEFAGAGGMVKHEFESSAKIIADASSSQTFSTSGEDIGTSFDLVNREATIPLSFQTLDLGVVPAGEAISISYSMKFSLRTTLVTPTTTGSNLLEFGQWQFADPANLSLSPVLMSVDLTPIPLPGAFWLLVSPLGLLLLFGRRSA